MNLIVRKPNTKKTLTNWLNSKFKLLNSKAIIKTCKKKLRPYKVADNISQIMRITSDLIEAGK